MNEVVKKFLEETKNFFNKDTEVADGHSVFVGADGFLHIPSHIFDDMEVQNAEE